MEQHEECHKQSMIPEINILWMFHMYNNIHKLIMMNKEVYDDVGTMHVSAYQCFSPEGAGVTHDWCISDKCVSKIP